MLILGMSPERFIWRRSFLMKSGWLKRLLWHELALEPGRLKVTDKEPG